VNLQATDGVEVSQDEIHHFVTMMNPGTTIAFFVHLKITKGANGEELFSSFVGRQLLHAVAR
jgi:hypothetical protein